MNHPLRRKKALNYVVNQQKWWMKFSERNHPMPTTHTLYIYSIFTTHPVHLRYIYYTPCIFTVYLLQTLFIYSICTTHPVYLQYIYYTLCIFTVYLLSARSFHSHSFFSIVLFSFRFFTNRSNTFKNTFYVFVLFSERWDCSWSFHSFLWKNDRFPGTMPSPTYNTEL